MTVAAPQPVALSPALCDSIADAANASGELGLPVLVLPAGLLTIVLVAQVARDPGHEWDAVADGVRATLLASLGYARRSLGQNLMLNDVVAAAHRTAGVVAFTVASVALVPGTATASELASKLPRLLASERPVPQVVDVGAAAANWADAAAAAAPRADAIAYLDPAVTDTLMLMEQA